MLEFNFHEIVGLRLHTEAPDAADFYRAELAAHLGAPSAGLPMVDLRWRRSWLPRSPGSDYRLHVHKALGRWHYRIALHREAVELDIVGNGLALPLTWHMLVLPSLRYLAAWQEALMLHAAAVVRHGSSLILTGPGGAGKTSTSSLLLRQGSEWQLHADDYLFLGPGLRSHALITRSHAYSDLLRWLPELRPRLTASEMLRLRLFGWVRKASGERLKWPIRLEAARLWPTREVAQSAKLGGILLIASRSGSELSVRHVESAGQTAVDLLDMNFHEARHFVRLLRKAMEPDQAQQAIDEWRAAELTGLERIVQLAPVYVLRLPQRPAEDGMLGRRLAESLKAVLDENTVRG